MTNQRSLFEVKSDELTVVFVPAGMGYFRPRFDRSGCVCQVTDNQGNSWLSADRRLEDSCGGFGLMEEFFPSDQGSYLSAGAGDPFLKMGVGILQKLDDSPYSQKVCYPVLQRVECNESFHETGADIVLEQPDFCGWSYRLEKKIRLDGRRLVITCRLWNTGNKILVFSVYNHNFLLPGQRQVGKNLWLRGSFVPGGQTAPFISTADGQLQLDRLTHPVGMQLEPDSRNSGWLCLADTRDSLAVHATLDRPVGHGYLWATQDTVCPEMFADFRVNSGASCSWERSYTFISRSCDFHCPGCQLNFASDLFDEQAALSER